MQFSSLTYYYFWYFFTIIFYKSYRVKAEWTWFLQLVTTLFSFIFAGLKFRENFLGTFRESLISRSRRKIVFAGNLISRNWRLSDFIFSFLQKLYVN